jgi:hypothetical protein
MTESTRLYFIALIDEALGSVDPSSALKEAITKILKMGTLQEYKEGYAQFQAFFETVMNSYLESSPSHEQSTRRAIYQFLHELITDTFVGNENDREALIEAVQRKPAWKAEFEIIRAGLQDLQSQPPMQVEVLRDDELIASFLMQEIPVNIRCVNPGGYVIRLSNGRVLWEGKLLKKHLLWLDAYGEEDLPMAARTEDTVRPTISGSLMSGELIWDVIPDLKSGELRFSHGKGKP